MPDATHDARGRRFRVSMIIDGIVHYRCHGPCNDLKPGDDYSPNKYACKPCCALAKRQKAAAERAAYPLAWLREGRVTRAAERAAKRPVSSAEVERLKREIFEKQLERMRSQSQGHV